MSRRSTRVAIAARTDVLGLLPLARPEGFFVRPPVAEDALTSAPPELPK